MVNDYIKTKLLPALSLKDKIIPILSLVLCAIFPIIFMFRNNIDLISNYSVIWEPIGVYIIVASICFVLGILIQRNFYKGLLNAFVLLLVFQYCNMVHFFFSSFFRSGRVWHLVIILGFVIWQTSFFLHLMINADNAKKITQVLCFIFSFLVLINLIPIVPTIISQTENENIEAPSVEIADIDLIDTPNIYFFIPDEMGNNETLKKYFNYDNSGFYERLRSLGFTVSEDSQNHTIDTLYILAGYFNLREVNIDENLSIDELHEMIANGILFDFLETAGYEIVGLGAAETHLGIGTADIITRNAGTVEGYTFAQMIYNHSLFSLLNFDVSLPPFAEQVLYLKNFFETDCLFNDTNGRFHLIYFASPHQPFVFDRYGNIMPTHRWHCWTDPNTYLEQYLYIASLLELWVARIIENDPDSIIIILSDHGPRFLRDPITRELVISLEYRQSIMNAVYYRGYPIPEIKGMSGVDTIRAVFSKLFNQELQ